MPRIRRVVSEQQPGVLRLPRNIPIQTAEDLGATTAQAIGQFGGQLQDVARKVKATDDELEVTRRRGLHDKAVAELAEQTRLHPDTFEQPALFKAGFASIAANTLQGASPAVAETLQRYINLTGPAAQVQAEADALKIASDKQLNALLAQADEDSRIAAQTDDPEERKKIMDGLAKIARNMAARGQMTFTDAGKFGRSLPEKVILDRMQFLANTDRPKLRAEEAAGLYKEADPVKRQRILRFADTEDARIERLARSQMIVQRFQANKEFFRRLHLDENSPDFLTMDDVIANPFLSREDRTFFEKALLQTEDPNTNPNTFIEIFDILHAPASSEQQRVKNARVAMQLAKEAYTDPGPERGSLGKTDAMELIRAAQDVLGGEDAEKDAYFKLAKNFLKDKFGWMGGEFGRFLDPEGADTYFLLMRQLMDDVRSMGLVKGQIFDHAQALAKPFASTFWFNMGGKPGRPIEEGLPPPTDFKAKTIIQSPRTKRVYRVTDDGKDWVEMR